MAIYDKIKSKLNFINKLNDLFSRKEKIQFLGVLVVSLLMAIFQAIGIASVLPFINIIMDPAVITDNQWLNFLFKLLNFESKNSFLVFFGFIVLGLLIIGNLVSAFATWLKIHFVWRKNHKLSSALLKKYLLMPYSYFLEHNTSDLSKNVLAEVQQLSNGFLLPIIKMVTDIILAAIILLLLLFVNPIMTIFAFFVLVFLYFVIFLYYSKKLKEGGIKRIERNKERFQIAAEALGGIKDIKVLGVEKYFLQKFHESSDEFSRLQAWYQVVGQIPRYIMEIIAFGGIVGLLIFLVLMGNNMQKIIPLVSFFAFAGYKLMPTLQNIFNSLSTFKFSKAILDKVHKDMTSGVILKKNIVSKKEKIKPLVFKNEIKLENIDFTYLNNNSATLKNISLKIKKNNFVAIIGTTGSGKTTLVDLVLGLFYPSKGSFKVDGTEITEDNIKNWQANLGYVPQQIYLSDDTIARNIALGIQNKQIDMKKVRKSAQMANIDEFINKELSDGYHTVIGERGIRLSGGQRQRIGIARALYRDPQVLIFDEATSSLDDKTEKEVLKAINEVAKFKTMIVIAHRLTTVKEADMVYLIENGKIIKKGSYKQVVKED